jgi:hypothetical protein
MDRFRTTGEDLSTASRSQFDEYWGHTDKSTNSGWVDIEDVADPTMPNPEQAMLIAEAEAEAEVREEGERFVNALRGDVQDKVTATGEDDKGSNIYRPSSPKYSGTKIGSKRLGQSKEGWKTGFNECKRGAKKPRDRYGKFSPRHLNRAWIKDSDVLKN